MGSFSDFTKMNTLQQDALAKSMGMSTDALSDMLFKQETMGMNAEQLRAVGKGELADRLEQVSAQEKMNLAQEKFQSLTCRYCCYSITYSRCLWEYGSIYL